MGTQGKLMVTAMTRSSPRALSVDVAIPHLLADGAAQAQVHSVFRRVINVVTPAGQLISLCGREHDDAPWSLRADVDGWAAWRVQAGAAVYADLDAVTVHDGGPRISLGGVRAWDAVAEPITADRDRLIDRAHELACVVRASGVPGGALRGPAHDLFAAVVAERISTGLADIVAGELAGHADDVEVAASSLLGLGPGLTPSGDDALTGLALVVSRPGSCATRVLPALRRVLSRHVDRTTALSWATLSAAVNGKARQRFLDLVDILVSRDHAEPVLLRERAGRVIGIGRTSGTDIACGVLAGIELEIQLRGRS
jgi:hypothetical protein